MPDSREYLVGEDLEEFIELDPSQKEDRNVFDSVRLTDAEPIPPEVDDIARIHQLIRERKPFTVLEFGVGYSTIAIADALAKNEAEWEALENPPKVRNRFMFEIFVVDSSKDWLEYWESEIPERFHDRITFTYSPVEMGTFNDRICHFYTDLPDIVPDFVYVDAPHPKQINGEIQGLSFNCDERTVMAGDLLRMEPTFLPGTFILIDGRTNNARFLERNFQREYEVVEDQEKDITTFELDEDRLGPLNISGTDYLDD